MTGIEWLIEAFGCADARLSDQAQLLELFETIIGRMELRPIGKPVWHVFPDSGGVTGVWLLQESHLAIHTWPEAGFVAVDVYVCNYTTDNSDKADRVFRALQAVLKPQRSRFQAIRRGGKDDGKES